MLTQKRITKLINPNFRHRILNSISKQKFNTCKIEAYARYTVDGMILHRDKEHENDKSYGYGFTPINVLCAVMKDGTIDKRFFECNSVNHFLRMKDGDSAVEVVECILVEWLKECKQIQDFDIDKIDAELVKIEAAYIEEQKRKEEQESKQASDEEKTASNDRTTTSPS